MFRRVFVPVLTVAVLTAASLDATAAMDLGRVDEYKLKSFSEYFGQYFDVANAEFDDKEFETKLRSEAADINLWLADPANWPPEAKIKPSMLADAGWLFFYFSNAGLPGAAEHSMAYLGKASKADPKNYLIPEKLARMAAQKGDAHRADVIRFAEQALAADATSAAKDNLHHLLATAYYAEGEFSKAYSELKKQAEVNPDFENTANLLFAWNLYVERWGRVPEKVTFKPGEGGVLRPEPVSGV